MSVMAKPPDLSTLGGRIKARRISLGMSQAALATAVTQRGIKLSQQNVVSIEQGHVARPRALPEIAAVLGSSIPWIRDGVSAEDLGAPLAGVGTAPIARLRKEKATPDTGPPQQLEVWASDDGGEENAMLITKGPIDHTARPAGLSAFGSFAVYLYGDDMSPAYEHGDQLFINPSRPIRGGLDCLFVQEKADGTLLGMAKRLVQSTPSRWRVKQYNPPREFQLDRAKWPKAWLIVGKLNKP